MKKFLAILLSLAMLFALVSCGSDSGKENKEEESQAEGKERCCTLR